jgi:hypothetical protein
MKKSVATLISLCAIAGIFYIYDFNSIKMVNFPSNNLAIEYNKFPENASDKTIGTTRIIMTNDTIKVRYIGNFIEVSYGKKSFILNSAPHEIHYK